MADSDSRGQDTTEKAAETDGGVAARGERAEYLDAEINIFRPATPFMRDHLKVVWATFLAWILFVFGPITATRIAPELMTETIVLGFQLHFLLTAVGAPLGALLLSIVYAYQRDRLDEQYGITHGDETTEESPTTVADGGSDQETTQAVSTGGEEQ